MATKEREYTERSDDIRKLFDIQRSLLESQQVVYEKIRHDVIDERESAKPELYSLKSLRYLALFFLAGSALLSPFIDVNDNGKLLLFATTLINVIMIAFLTSTVSKRFRK